jgi:hypothetical protein
MIRRFSGFFGFPPKSGSVHLQKYPRILHENGPWRPFVLKNVFPSPLRFFISRACNALFLKNRQREILLSLS